MLRVYQSESVKGRAQKELGAKVLSLFWHTPKGVLNCVIFRIKPQKVAHGLIQELMR